jgi:hypothetical protein
MELSDILEVTDDLTQPRWVECPEVPGFAIFLRLPDVPGLRGLALQAVSTARDRAGAEGLAEFDPGAVGLRLTDYSVQDWRGLTGKGLRYFSEGSRNLNIKAPDDVEISFNRQVLEILLKWSSRFYEFVDRSWRNQEIQGLQAREDDEKNSLNAPGTTLTPAPDNAAGA